MLNLLLWWGLILTFVTALWHGSKRLAMNAGAQECEDHGEHYLCREEHAKGGRLINLLLSFEIPRHLSFRLRREGWFDAFGKATRLAVEPQAGHSRFDEVFYIDTGDQPLIALLQAQADLRATLLSLMLRLKSQSARLLSLSGEDGKLHLYLHVAPVRHVGRLRGECVGWLAPLLQALRRLPAAHTGAQRSRKVKADLPRLVSFGLFTVGAFAAAWIAFVSPERLIDAWALFVFSLAPGAILFLILLLWAVRRVDALSNRHRGLFEWVALALPGMVLCSFVAVRGINLHLDFAVPQAIPVHDVGLYTTYRRKVGTIHHVGFKSDHPAIDGGHSMVIGASHYRRLNATWRGTKSDKATLLLHPGVFGFAWKEIIP